MPHVVGAVPANPMTLVQAYLLMLLWFALAVVYTLLFDHLLNLIGALSCHSTTSGLMVNT